MRCAIAREIVIEAGKRQNGATGTSSGGAVTVVSESELSSKLLLFSFKIK